MYNTVKALSCPYEIRPENQGKLVWLSGPPGAGKSTTGQLMGRHAGWRYYEADCSMYGLNPFVPLSFDNPTLGAFQQPVLKVNRVLNRWTVPNEHTGVKVFIKKQAHSHKLAHRDVFSV